MPSSVPQFTTGLCPICGDAKLQFGFEKQGRRFWICTLCGLGLQWPLPTPNQLQRYYDEQYAAGMYATFTAASAMKTMTARQRIKELRPWVQVAGRWLDVGCADGVFVREAAAAGAQASGVELSSVAASQARAAGLDVQCGHLHDVDSAPAFDCITGFDVLEHVLEPRAMLQQIHQRLKPGGHVVLTLPDSSSVFARLMRSRWWFYIPQEHLHYFNPRTVKALGTLVGLEPVHVARTFKPLTYNYGLTQFKEFNPLIYKVLRGLSALIPERLREVIMPLYIGEMMVVFRKPLQQA